VLCLPPDDACAAIVVALVQCSNCAERGFVAILRKRAQGGSLKDSYTCDMRDRAL
jgi:hypothetical protein